MFPSVFSKFYFCCDSPLKVKDKIQNEIFIFSVILLHGRLLALCRNPKTLYYYMYTSWSNLGKRGDIVWSVRIRKTAIRMFLRQENASNYQHIRNQTLSSYVAL